MTVTAERPGPYAPPATILDVIMRFRERGMQTPFTADVLSRAGVSDSLISRTLQSLRVLDLIDDNGDPTNVLRLLAQAPQEELQQRMREWLTAAYAEVFQFTDPAEDDPSRVRDAFRSYEPRGQQDRMVTLFLRLCQEAGIRSGTQEGSPRPRPTTRVRRDPAPPASRRRSSGNRSTRQDQQDVVSGLPQPLAGLLASLPASGRWRKDQRDKFITTFTAVLDFCVEVGEDERATDEGSGDP